MIDIRFFQAAATALPTLVIATLLTSRYLDSSKSSESGFARTLTVSILMALTIVGETVALATLAGAGGNGTLGTNEALWPFRIVVAALMANMVALGFILATQNMKDMTVQQLCVCLGFLAVSIAVMAYVLGPLIVR